MDASLFHTLQAARSAAANTVSNALAPKGAAQSTLKNNATRTAVTPQAAATANAASNSSSTSDTGTSTITSEDFLTLLVSELKNQDPTQPTDPNEYISQLVGVNSLEQLIQINNGLSTLEPASSTGASSATKAVSGASAA